MVHSVSCAAAKQQFNDEEHRLLNTVRVLKQEPARLVDCKYLGPIESRDGSHGGGTFRLGEFEQAMKMLQLKASQKGGNLVILDSEVSSRNETEFAYILRGRSFNCF